MITLTCCPTCGSDKIERIQRDWTALVREQSITVPALEFYECPNCGERVFDHQAMQAIEAHYPPRKKARTTTRTA